MDQIWLKDDSSQGKRLEVNQSAIRYQEEFAYLFALFSFLGRFPDNLRGGLVYILGRLAGPVRLHHMLCERVANEGWTSSGNGILQIEQLLAP